MPRKIPAKKEYRKIWKSVKKCRNYWSVKKLYNEQSVFRELTGIHPPPAFSYIMKIRVERAGLILYGESCLFYYTA